MTLQQMKMVMGGAGGGGPSGGYTDFTASSPLLLGNMNSFSNAQRTITAPGGVAAGDLLVAIIGEGGHTGQSLGSFFTPTFAQWSSAGGWSHTASDTSERMIRIAPRISTGNAQDNCLFGSNGPFPAVCQVIRFTGNVWSGALSSITVDNENSEDLSDTDFLRENAPAGASTFTLRVFASAKRASDSENGVAPNGTDQGIVSLAQANSLDNGFSQSVLAAFGFKFMAAAVDVPGGDWVDADSFTNAVGAVSATFKSDDS